jgi:translation initiation factor IF-3
MKLRPKIDPHDYATKKGHVVRFLKQGDKVKITIMFRGREQSRPELGFRLLQRLAEDVQELGFVEWAPKQDGRNMIMVLGPTKKKADARAERAADRARREGARDESATPTAPADAATEDATAAEATPDIGAQPEAAASEQPVA